MDLDAGYLEQMARDNEALRDGEVNRSVGIHFQLRPYTMAHLLVAAFAFIASLFVYAMWGFEVAILTFIVLCLGLILLGGKDFDLEKEKLKKTRSFFSETPQLTHGPDKLPKAKFIDESYVEKEGRRYYSIEQQFREFRFYGSYERNQSNAGFYYLNPGKSVNVWLVFGFKVEGFSPCVDHVDCFAAVKRISRAFRNTPDLKLKFVWEIPSDGSAQILQQKQLLEMCEQDDLTVEIIKSEGNWATRLEKSGGVVAPKLRVYARVKSPLGQKNFTPQDWKDRWLARVVPYLAQLGDTPKLSMARQAIDFAFTSGCTQTMRIFNSEIGVRARPLNVHELYSIDYNKFHKKPVDTCPQYIRATDDGLILHEQLNEDGSPVVPHHILGELFSKEGLTSVPSFYRDRIWYPLKGKTDADGKERGRFAACLRLNQLEGFADIDGSHAKGHTQNIYNWLIGLSDVEVISEVEALDPRPRKSQLDRGITNRTKRVRGAVERESLDVDSSEEIEELREARRELRLGAKTLSALTLIWVYADTKEELSLKVKTLIGRIGESNCLLVQNSIEQHFVDSQPYAYAAMGINPMRRTEYMVPQAIPSIPFTNTQKVHERGKGFIGKGLSAQYFIDFVLQKNHSLINAKSGGGKSMMGLGILADCIATKTPSLFLDSPPMAEEGTKKVAQSTYAPAIEVWKSKGVPCAYQDIKKNNFNIIGRNGFGKNTFEIDAILEGHLSILMAVVLGDDPKHRLAGYVENLLSLSYKEFLGATLDHDEDPILSDFLKHYNNWSNRYQTGQIDYEAITGVSGLEGYTCSAVEKEALSLISSQILGVLAQPWGKRINAQTSFDTDVLHLVLGLTDVKAGSKEGLVYALAAIAFMSRLAAKYDRSVGLMDEGSTLLPMEAFAERFSRFFTEGRKKGINGILLTTELDSVWNSPYSGQIIDNFDTVLVGNSEETSVKKFVERLGFKFPILRKYTVEPDKTTMSSQWYLKRGNLHLELIYYTTPLLLALGATSPEEISVRNQYLKGVSPNNYIQAYKQLGKDLYATYSQGRSVKTLLRSDTHDDN